MLVMIFTTGAIIFQTALPKLTVTAGRDSGLPFSLDLACQLPWVKIEFVAIEKA